MTTRTAATASNVKEEVKAKGPAQNPTAQAQGMPDWNTWVEQQVGFPPYWSPKPGEWIYGQIVARDEGNADAAGNFTRYMIKAGKDTECLRGSKLRKTEEPELVKAGEFFSISVYHSLEDLFEFYLESGIMPFVRLDAVNKVPTASGQTVWKWKLKVSPEDHKKLNEERTRRHQLAAAADAAEFNPELLNAPEAAS